MSSIRDLIKEMKGAELEEFSTQQYKTILVLNKENDELKREVAHLKSILENSTPLLETDKSKFISPNEPSEKVISEIQLNRLSKVAMERELTMEEAKKVEVYSKILNNLANKKQIKEVQAEVISSDDLTKMLNDETS